MPVDPIPALDGLLRAIDASLAPESPLRAAARSLRERARTAPEHDASAWRDVYSSALEVLARATSDAPGGEGVAAGGSSSVLEADVARALERSLARWPDRISQQQREIDEKVVAASASADIGRRDDPVRGDTVFEVRPEERHRLESWLLELERTWLTNNAALFAARANAEGETSNPQFARCAFKFEPPTLVPRAVSLALAGDRARLPGAAEVFGTGYKLLLSALGALSAGALAYSRWVDTSAPVAAPWVLVGCTVVTLVYAAATIPRRRVQLVAGLTSDALAKARAELKQAALAIARGWGSEQLEALRAHADRERTRWILHARAMASGSRPGASAGQDPGLEARLHALREPMRERLRALDGGADRVTD